MKRATTDFYLFQYCRFFCPKKNSVIISDVLLSQHWCLLLKISWTLWYDWCVLATLLIAYILFLLGVLFWNKMHSLWRVQLVACQDLLWHSCFYSQCSLRHLLIICGMVGDWQLMGKFCLEVMELRHCIRLILNQWKVFFIQTLSVPVLFSNNLFLR